MSATKSDTVREQLQFRRDHKTLCLERAIERCDYDAANIFSAQRDWIDGQMADSVRRNEPLFVDADGNPHYAR
jgi:hypothetical protein